MDICPQPLLLLCMGCIWKREKMGNSAVIVTKPEVWEKMYRPSLNQRCPVDARTSSCYGHTTALANE
jgi:hypothetical protein